MHAGTISLQKLPYFRVGLIWECESERGPKQPKLANHGNNWILYFIGRGGAAGGKFRITLGLPVGAVINCADNTGEENNLRTWHSVILEVNRTFGF